jgi:hypothetical protein
VPAGDTGAVSSATIAPAVSSVFKKSAQQGDRTTFNM